MPNTRLHSGDIVSAIQSFGASETLTRSRMRKIPSLLFCYADLNPYRLVSLSLLYYLSLHTGNEERSDAAF